MSGKFKLFKSILNAKKYKKLKAFYNEPVIAVGYISMNPSCMMEQLIEVDFYKILNDDDYHGSQVGTVLHELYPQCREELISKYGYNYLNSLFLQDNWHDPEDDRDDQDIFTNYFLNQRIGYYYKTTPFEVEFVDLGELGVLFNALMEEAEQYYEDNKNRLHNKFANVEEYKNFLIRFIDH